MTTPRRLLTTLGLAVPTLAAALVAVAPAAPASADSRVTVTNDRGTSQADVTYRTSMTVRGSGFQVVQGGFGGVYVMFGWVRNPSSGAWRPSEGGLTGQDYQYVPDAEDAADNAGYLKFVAFPGSSTAGEAAAVLSRSGGFTVDLIIPGPTFQSVDRDGDVAEVDCREVQCGVITIGAHGVVNNRNETFTPVDFASVYDAAPTDTATTTAPTTPTDTATTPADPGATDTTPDGPDGPRDPAQPTDGAAPVAGTAVLEVDRTTAVAGHALAFTARGFTPGEQVVGVLDDGLAAIGPIVAGASGEIAGVLQLSPDLAVGTHELRLTGAASTTAVSALFPVSAGDTTTVAPAADTDTATSDDGSALPYVFLVAAAAVLLVSVVVRLVLHRRRRPTPPAPPAPVVVAGGPA